MPLHLRAHMHVFCACTHDSACAAVCTRVHPCIKEEVQSCTHVFSSLQTALHVGGLLLYVHLLSASITADMDYFVTNTNNQKPILQEEENAWTDALSTHRAGKRVITVTISSGSIVGRAQPDRLGEDAMFCWPRGMKDAFPCATVCKHKT